MTEETLKYYIAMQPKFREVMGYWQPFDFCFHTTYRHGIILKISDVAKDIFMQFLNNHFASWWFSGYGKEEVILPIPLLIDPRNPERGLWGMVDWRKWRIQSGANGMIMLWCSDNDTGEEVPELALLKALAYQWGIDVI